MKRFYKRAIDALKNKLNQEELAEDIDSYVNHMELKMAVMASELAQIDTPMNKHLLNTLGYKTGDGNDGLDLLPCAHCGSTATLQQENKSDSAGGWFVECGNWRCRMTTPLKFAVMDDVAPLLTEIWNRRSNAELTSPPDTEPKRSEEL